MEKININIVDEPLYYEKLENGLEVYMIPKNNVKNIYATFTTRFGSKDDEFVPINENKMVKVPLGIAHFLEHKMFEQEDGIDPFTFYSKSGTSANAHTSFFNTTYEFSGPNNFLENLKYLLDFVQKPYLTPQNIEKEKGIIIQELKMYLDDPFWVLYDGIRNNIFYKNPMKYPIIGTIDSINNINKKDLLRCYNTFYHPSNMFVVITGNFDPNETINTIRENQLSKKFKPMPKIKTKEYKESDKVVKEEEIVFKNVDNAKLSYGIKLNLDKLGVKEKRKQSLYLYILFELMFGTSSKFYEEMMEKGYLSSSVSIDKIFTDTHVLIILTFESNYPKELCKEIKNTLDNMEISAKDLEIMKKGILSIKINAFDNIIALNDVIVSNIIDLGEFGSDFVECVKELNLDELNIMIKKMDLSNYSIYIVNPLNK